jgi:hypothetical protein
MDSRHRSAWRQAEGCPASLWWLDAAKLATDAQTTHTVPKIQARKGKRPNKTVAYLRGDGRFTTNLLLINLIDNRCGPETPSTLLMDLHNQL